MRVRRIMNKRNIIIFLCLILFLIIGLYVIKIDGNVIDSSFYNFIISFKSKYTTLFFKGVTFLSSVLFMVVVSILLLLVKKIKYRKLMLINIILDVILNTCLKYIFRRERPRDIMMVIENGFSFPSGHTMLATIFYGFIIYLIYKSDKSRKFKYVSIILLSLLILLIGISRIYLGVHYTTDVLGGYLISISYLMIFIYYIEKKNLLVKMK